MKTNKTFAYGSGMDAAVTNLWSLRSKLRVLKSSWTMILILIALAFIACPDEKTPESNPPVANAKAEPTHTLADNLTITLDGTDSTGNISAYAWECETYTADQGTVSAEYTKAQVDALITNADTATAAVKPRKAGTYKFKLTVTGNDNESDTDTVEVVVEGLSECTVEFVTLAASFPNPTIDFSPSATLPVGVTYILTDNSTPQNSWNSAEVFNGQITAADYYVGVNNQVTFTQTFYFNDVKITGANSDRTVVITAGTSATTRFVTSNSDTGSVTLKWTEILDTITATVNVAAVPFTIGTELKFKVDSNNYSFVDGTPNGFVANDLNDITYTLSSANPVKDLSAYSNGNIPLSAFADMEYPTITQTFYYNGQVVGSRKIVTSLGPTAFVSLHEYKPTEIDGILYDSDFVEINAIPATTLNISKTKTEL